MYLCFKITQMFQAKYFNAYIQGKIYTGRSMNLTQNGVLAVFSAVYKRMNSLTLNLLQFSFIHHVQNKINSEDFKWTQLLNFEHFFKQRCYENKRKLHWRD